MRLQKTPFQLLGEGCRALASTHPSIRITIDNDRKFEALFCDPTEEDGVIFAERTYYELGYDKFYLEREPLESSDDVQRALATLDALFAGKAVTLSSADGLASRTWVFVNSRGLRTTVTESRISCALGQRTAWRGRKWHRHRMRPLAEFVVA